MYRQKKLKCYGLTCNHLLGKDTLFLYHLLLPIEGPKCDGGIENDQYKGYFKNVLFFKELNTLERTQNGGCHDIKKFKTWELVRFNGIIFYNGLKYGRNQDLYNQWKSNDETEYDKIKNALKPMRFLKIKTFLKWNHNFFFFF